MSKTLEKGYIEKKEKGSGQYQDLYLEGIELLQKLSGGLWTDYNEHDPGVTIFENLAYTLTSLSYKVDMPIIDILTESKKRELISGDNGFFIASEILTTNPIVKEDYRKVLVDGIKNVKNVWIHTLNQGRDAPEPGKLNLRGLYHVFIEMYEYDTNQTALEKEEERVKSEARMLFHAQRNLCEDLYEVSVLRPWKLEMKLHLTLDMEADGEDVFGQVYYDINDFLTHEAKFESLWELKQQEVDFNSIHTGPTLDHGFIRDRELREMKRRIYVSDLTKIISKVPGVVNIDKLIVRKDKKDIDEKYKDEKDKDEEYTFGQEIIVPDGHTPRFELPNQGKVDDNLEFKTADIQLNPNAREIKNRYVSIEAEHYGNFKTVSESLNKAEIPPGEILGIPAYHSVREQFPAIYGIGHWGLPPHSSDERIAQAKQLKAYLLPFDQLMTNFLAQLNNVYTLYNVNETKLETYFYQVLEDMRDMVNHPRPKDNHMLAERRRLKLLADNDIHAIVKVDHSNKKHTLGQWKDTLKALNGDCDIRAIERLNEVTDTMLARFAEDFPTYVLQKINTSCFGKHFTDEEFDQKLLRWKRKLIANYGHLSYNRARSFNYLENKSNDNASSTTSTLPVIVEKIAILLGIRHSELRNITEVMGHKEFDHKLMMDTKDSDHKQDELSILKKLFENMRKRALDGQINETNLNAFFRLGVADQGFYKVDNRGVGGQIELRLKDENSMLLYRARSFEKLKKARQLTITMMKKLNERTEGIHLLEHILLAPPATGNYFGFTFSVLTKKYTEGAIEQMKFRHTSQKSSDQRNKDVDIIKDAMESGTLLEFRKMSSPGNKSFWIEIYKDQHGPYAISESQVASEALVDIDIKALNDLQDRQDRYSMEEVNYLAYLNDTEINESFFSFRMSFILPAWPVRFQNKSFQTQFNNILYQQVPIHIQYNSHWLELNRMRKFEEAYFKWLKLLQNKENDKDRMASALALVNILKEFQNSDDRV